MFGFGFRVKFYPTNQRRMDDGDVTLANNVGMRAYT